MSCSWDLQRISGTGSRRGRFPNIVSATGGVYQFKDPAIYGHEGTPALRIEAMPKDLNEIRINHARSFYDCTRTRRKPILDAHLGYQVITAIQLASDSYRKRRMMGADEGSGARRIGGNG